MREVTCFWVVLDCEVGELLEMWDYQADCTNYACIIGYVCVTWHEHFRIV
jgi:hypothetical protein